MFSYFTFFANVIKSIKFFKLFQQKYLTLHSFLCFLLMLQKFKHNSSKTYSFKYLDVVYWKSTQETLNNTLAEILNIFKVFLTVVSY